MKNFIESGSLKFEQSLISTEAFCNRQLVLKLLWIF